MRTLIVAFTLLLLAGCWTGPELFTAADTQAVVPAGLYRQTDGNGVQKRMRVTLRADGMTHVEYVDDPQEAPLLVGFVPLGPSGDSFIAWSGPADLPTGVRVYGLFRRQPDGSFTFLSPPCSEEAGADRVVRATPPPGVEAGLSCEFRSRDRLVAAMRRFDENPVTPPDSRLQFTRIDG